MSHKHNNEPHHNGQERTRVLVTDTALPDLGMSIRALHPDYTELEQAPVQETAPKLTLVPAVEAPSTSEQIAPFTGIVNAEATGVDMIRGNVAQVYDNAPIQNLSAILGEAA